MEAASRANTDVEAKIPTEATNVEMDARARVVIRVTHPEGEVNIPDFFEHVLKMMRDRVAIPLGPYLHVQGSSTG